MNGFKKNNIVKIKVFLTLIIGVAVILTSLAYFKNYPSNSNFTNGQQFFKKDYNFIFILNEPYRESKDDKVREYLKDYNGSVINSVIIMSIKTNDKKISLYRLPIILQYFDKEVGYSDELKYYYCNTNDEKNLKLFMENIIKNNIDAIYKINTNSLKNLKQLSLNLETNEEENIWTIDNKRYIISKNDYENVNKEDVKSIITKIIVNYSKLSKNQRYNLITSIVSSSYSDVSLKKVSDVLNKVCDEPNPNTYELKVENIEFKAKIMSEIVKNIDDKYKDIQLVYYDENFDLNKNYFINKLNKTVNLESKNEESKINTPTTDNRDIESQSNKNKSKNTNKQTNTTKENQTQSDSSGISESSNDDNNKNEQSIVENQEDEKQSNEETKENKEEEKQSNEETKENQGDVQQTTETEPKDESTEEGSQQP